MVWPPGPQPEQPGRTDRIDTTAARLPGWGQAGLVLQRASLDQFLVFFLPCAASMAHDAELTSMTSSIVRSGIQLLYLSVYVVVSASHSPL